MVSVVLVLLLLAIAPAAFACPRMAQHVTCYSLDRCHQEHESNMPADEYPPCCLCRTRVLDATGIVSVKAGQVLVNGRPLVQHDCTIEPAPAPGNGAQ